MKTRKAFLVLLTIACMTAFFSMEALAGQWVTCTIDQVGPYGLVEGTHGSYIYLTDTADPPAWVGSKKMRISPNRGKEFLAVALTALASGKQIKVFVNPGVALPTIAGMYIQN